MGQPVPYLLFDNAQQMWNFSDNTTCRCRILMNDDLVELCDSQCLDDLFLFFSVPDHAPVVLNLDLSVLCFCFLCHFSILKCRSAIFKKLFSNANRKLRSQDYANSSTCLPRSRATSIGSFILKSPLKVARITL